MRGQNYKPPAAFNFAVGSSLRLPNPPLTKRQIRPFDSAYVQSADRTLAYEAATHTCQKTTKGIRCGKPAPITKTRGGRRRHFCAEHAMYR